MEAPAASRIDAPSLVARLRAHLAAKLGAWIVLALGICVPYFGLQHVAGPAPQEVGGTAIDHAIPFLPGWIYAYVSLGVLVPLGPLLATTRAELARYLRGLALLCVPCFVIFHLLPVTGPRPEAAAAAPGLYDAIVFLDRPSNSMPSLHAGLTVFSLLYIDRVFGRSLGAVGRRRVMTAGVVWGALILFSTLATKQHWLMDLPAGMALGWGADRLAWRPRPARPPAPRG